MAEPIYDMYDEYYDDECPICGSSMDWEPCDLCGGEGYYDAYESDPLWYDEGDVERCSQCNGEGGWAICLNRKNHPQEVQP